MKLIDLEPRLFRLADINGDSASLERVDSLAEAQGIRFVCPKCFVSNNGPIGTHYIICLFRDKGIPNNIMQTIARWFVSGKDFSDLTLTPSILLPDNCMWHGFITNGMIL